jgi:hypothetical protein
VGGSFGSSGNNFSMRSMVEAPNEITPKTRSMGIVFFVNLLFIAVNLSSAMNNRSPGMT